MGRSPGGGPRAPTLAVGVIARGVGLVAWLGGRAPSGPPAPGGPGPSERVASPAPTGNPTSVPAPSRRAPVRGGVPLPPPGPPLRRPGRFRSGPRVEPARRPKRVVRSRRWGNIFLFSLHSCLYGFWGIFIMGLAFTPLLFPKNSPLGPRLGKKRPPSGGKPLLPARAVKRPGGVHGVSPFGRRSFENFFLKIFENFKKKSKNKKTPGDGAPRLGPWSPGEEGAASGKKGPPGERGCWEKNPGGRIFKIFSIKIILK